VTEFGYNFSAKIIYVMIIVVLKAHLKFNITIFMMNGFFKKKHPLDAFHQLLF